jgi:nitroreductase
MQSPYDFLATRRSIPAAFLAAPAPDNEALRQILTVGARVPDHGKLGPWRFIVIRGEARLRLGEDCLAIRRRSKPGLSEIEEVNERTRFAKAPLVIALVSRPMPSEKATEWEQILSAGAVAMNVLNATHALGFAANWLTDWPAYDPDVRDLLGLGESERFVGFIHIGTPTTPPQERYRPKLDDLVSEWAPL